MPRKIIGIPGWSTGDNSFGCTKTYLAWISNFGIAKILTPEEDVQDLDLLVLPGGLDVDPVSYGQVPGFYTSNVDVFKNYFVQKMLPQYIDRGTPIFGICLGMQQLAVHYGSIMTQNLIYHEQSKNRWETAHNVYFKVNEAKLPKDNNAASPGFKVNSHHHQCVTMNNLGPDLNPILVSPNHDDYGLQRNDGHIVEAFAHNNKPIIGVQWHPEELYDRWSTDIVNQLLDERGI